MAKYVKHVADCCGETFIQTGYLSDFDFTDKEIKALEYINNNERFIRDTTKENYCHLTELKQITK